MCRGILAVALMGSLLVAIAWSTRSRFLVPQLKSWVVAQAEEQGYRVELRDLTLDLNALHAEGVAVTRGKEENPAPLVELRAESIHADVSLWQLATRGLRAIREVHLEIESLHLRETAQSNAAETGSHSALPATSELPELILQLEQFIWERTDGQQLVAQATEIKLAPLDDHLQLSGKLELGAGHVEFGGRLQDELLQLTAKCEALPLGAIAVLWRGEASLAGDASGEFQLELPFEDPLAFTVKGGPLQIEKLSAYGFKTERVSAIPSWRGGTVQLQSLSIDNASGSIRSDDLRLGVLEQRTEGLADHRLLLRDAGSVFEHLEGDFDVQSSDLREWLGEWIPAEDFESLSLSGLEARGRFARSQSISLPYAALTAGSGTAVVEDLVLAPATNGGAPSWNLDSWRLFEVTGGSVTAHASNLSQFAEKLAGSASLRASPVGPLGAPRGAFAIDALVGSNAEDLRPITLAVEVDGSDWSQRTLSVRELELRSQEQTLLQGSGAIPLSREPRRTDAAPFEARLSIEEIATHLPRGLLPSLLPGAPDLKGPLSGQLSFSSPASRGRLGTLELVSDALELHLVDAAGEDLAIGPTTLDCTATLEGSQVRLSKLNLSDQDARFVLSGEGALPLDSSAGEFDLRAEVRVAEIDAFSTPLSGLLGFRLPLRAGRLRGSATVTGPFGEPDVNSKLTLEECVLALGSPLPAATRVFSEISLHPGRIEIESLRGELGASPFQANGQITLASGAPPQLSIQFQGDNLLFVRQRTLRVRADANLQLTGSVENLLAKGDLLLRGGRLTAPVEFLDFSRRSAQDKSEQALGLQIFSLPSPPLSAMRFDINVRTAEPFRIENNVAKGGVRPSLKLEGTGQTPLLEGTVFIDPTRVSLPATSLQVQSGRVDFERNNPFFPTLAINGATRIRGIDIEARVAGRFDDPEIYLSSSPAQPNEDLVYLLLTGTLPESSFASSSRQAAQSLAVYLAQDFIQRWFGGDGSADDGESFAERIEFQRGQDVSRSGSETLQASFRLKRDLTREEDALYLTAEKDVYDHVNFGLRLVFRFE